jgi:heterotetrameric sarcosine oxidase gamma subunit
VPEPIARSPVSPIQPADPAVADPAVAGPGVGGLTLTDLSLAAKVAVRASPGAGLAGALGVPFGRAARDGSGALVIGSGPGEWLVLGPPGSASTLQDRLTGQAARDAGDELVTVLDLTHGIALLRLTGARAAAVLAALCGIDLGERNTPQGAVFSSLVAGVVTGVVRDDMDGAPDAVPAYLLHCERSYGQYLFDVVLDAGAEFGIETGGFRPPGI